MEKKVGKSWKREREERGRRQLAQKDRTSIDGNENTEDRASEEIDVADNNNEEKSQVIESSDQTNKEPRVNETVMEVKEEENSEEEKKELMQFITEVSEKLKMKAELRSVNANADYMLLETECKIFANLFPSIAGRPEESFFGKLDSSLKKNTAFIKRLKNMTEAQKDSLIKDMNGLNLTKYISEAASAIVDAKLKMSDVNTAVQICSLLHQRYSEFSAQLLEHWQKVLPMKKDEKIQNPSKIRVDLRFYAELVSCGVFSLREGLPLLGNLLTVLTASDKEEHGNVNILLSFCRHCGEDYAGLVPRKIRILSQKFNMEIPKSDFLPPDRQKGLRNLLKEYYKSLCKHLIKDYKVLQNMEKQNHRILQTKGELSNERKDKYEAAQNAFQKLLYNTQQFADIVDEDVPELPKDESFTPDSEATTLDVHNRFKDDIFLGYYQYQMQRQKKAYSAFKLIKTDNRNLLSTEVLNNLLTISLKEPELCNLNPEKTVAKFFDKVNQHSSTQPHGKRIRFSTDSASEVNPPHIMESDGSLSIWEDDDTRCFYENLPDLKAFIPGILFKDSSQTPQPVENIDEKLEEDLSKLDLEDSEILDVEVKESEVKDSNKSDDKDLTETLMQEIEEIEEDSAATNTANKLLLDGFLTSLLNCVNREIIDQAAVDFCMNLNTRPNRKKLVRSLFLVPRTRLDLLPFYARFVAILNPCMPDIASDLVAMLKQDFKFHIKKKDQINIESKVKTVRFIGELVKFKIFPKSEALFCLKLLLSDFMHHHIEMACNLLETCGRFLFRAPDSHQRTKVLLDQMMRKKSVMSLDSRYTTMIENAFYYCNPPEIAPTVRKERPPMHEYIRKLLYKDLTKNIEKGAEKYSSSTKVLRQMRKLDWDDAETAAYITKCLAGVWNVKFYNIRCLANLLACLVSYQENIGPQVVDGVLEDIRLGMEIVACHDGSDSATNELISNDRCMVLIDELIKGKEQKSFIDETHMANIYKMQVNHPKYNQRRVSMVRYLGELYNYRMVESAVIFRVLYSFITFGVNYDGSYSELDPPEHLFRIRLVCILLDTCGQYFNSGSSKKKLDCFLVFFQRYYWHKRSSEIYNDEFPFPVTVTFLVHDTIAALRPKLKLYESLEEAIQGVEDLIKELKPKIVEVCPNLLTDEETETQKSPASTPKDDSLGPIEEVDEDLDDDAHSDGTDQEEETEGDTDGFSGSQSQPFEDESEMKYHGMSQGDTENDSSQILDGSQDSPVVKPVTKQVQSAEDEDFMAAFDKMLSESILHRNQESVKPQVDIVIPMNIKGSNTKKKLSTLDIKEEEKRTINFVLMTRKGNKQQFKNLAVPVTSELAQNLKDREEAERVEKQHVKLLTLNINERQEEEDYQEMLAAQQRPSVMNLNRDRRQKYHHPKGAPDADLIFGNNNGKSIMEKNETSVC